MPKKKETVECGIGSMCCTGVEALVTVDERGQMVLPKELRDRAHIRGGDKLAIIAWQHSGGDICCLSLVKAESIKPMVSGLLHIVGEDISGKK
jgi:antitoxin PrlF